MNTNQADHYKFSLLKIRHILVERFLFGIFLIGLFGGPASILRSLFTGWLHLYTFHIFITVLITFFYIFRNKIPFFIKSFFVVFCGFIIGTVGLFNFGILSVGIWWLIMNCLLINTLYSFRTCILAFIVSTIIILISGYFFINGVITYKVDLYEYVNNPISWIIIYIGSIAYPLVFFNTITSIQIESLSIFNKLSSQKKRINKMSDNDTLINIMDEANLIKILDSKINQSSINHNKFAYFLIEFEGLQLINELLGDKAYDFVLNEIANRLIQIVSNNDIAMRINENQYIVILEDINLINNFAEISLEIFDTINAPIKYKRKSIDLNIRIGIGIYPDHAESVTTLKYLTSQALNSIKKNDKKQYAFIKPLKTI